MMCIATVYSFISTFSFVFMSIAVESSQKTSKLCCDVKCEVPISRGWTTVAYKQESAADSYLSFEKNTPVVIFSKQVAQASQVDYIWEGMVNDRRGLVNSSNIKESEILCSNPQQSVIHDMAHHSLSDIPKEILSFVNTSQLDDNINNPFHYDNVTNPSDTTEYMYDKEGYMYGDEGYMNEDEDGDEEYMDGDEEYMNGDGEYMDEDEEYMNGDEEYMDGDYNDNDYDVEDDIPTVQLHQEDPVPPHEDPVPRHQDTVPSHQDPVPPHQDTVISNQDPIPSHQDPAPSYQNRPVSHHEYPVPPHQDPVPPHQDSAVPPHQNPVPPHQDRPVLPNQNPVPSHQSPVPSHQDKVPPPQEPVLHHQDPVPPHQDPVPPPQDPVLPHQDHSVPSHQDRPVQPHHDRPVLLTKILDMSVYLSIINYVAFLQKRLIIIGPERILVIAINMVIYILIFCKINKHYNRLCSLRGVEINSYTQNQKLLQNIVTTLEDKIRSLQNESISNKNIIDSLVKEKAKLQEEYRSVITRLHESSNQMIELTSNNNELSMKIKSYMNEKRLMGQKDHTNKGLLEQKYKKIENTFQQLRLNYSNLFGDLTDVIYMNYKLRVSNNSNNDDVQSAKPLLAKPKQNPITNEISFNGGNYGERSNFFTQIHELRRIIGVSHVKRAEKLLSQLLKTEQLLTDSQCEINNLNRLIRDRDSLRNVPRVPARHIVYGPPSRHIVYGPTAMMNGCPPQQWLASKPSCMPTGPPRGPIAVSPLVTQATKPPLVSDTTNITNAPAVSETRMVTAKSGFAPAHGLLPIPIITNGQSIISHAGHIPIAAPIQSPAANPTPTHSEGVLPLSAEPHPNPAQRPIKGNIELLV